MTRCHLPLSIFNILRASSASTGFRSSFPSISPTVSAATTGSPSIFSEKVSMTCSIFISARRRVNFSGEDISISLSSIPGTSISTVKPALRSTSNLAFEPDASATFIIPTTQFFISVSMLSMDISPLECMMAISPFFSLLP